MQARNAKTGARITAALHEVYGRAAIDQTAFNRTPTGTLTFEELDRDIELLWETTQQVKRDGNPVFLDENGDELIPEEIELCTNPDQPSDHPH